MPFLTTSLQVIRVMCCDMEEQLLCQLFWQICSTENKYIGWWIWSVREVFLGPFETPMMSFFFAKIVNVSYLLTILVKKLRHGCLTYVCPKYVSSALCTIFTAVTIVTSKFIQRCDFPGIFQKIFRVAIFPDGPEGLILFYDLIPHFHWFKSFNCFLDASGPSC